MGKCDASFCSGPTKLPDNILALEVCASVFPSSPEPLSSSTSCCENKHVSASIGSQLVFPQTLDSGIVGHVIREELEPVQQLVQEWAVRQKTCENRITVLEQRFNRLPTSSPLSGLSTLWRPQLCC